MQSECRKIQTRKSPKTGTFQAVVSITYGILNGLYQKILQIKIVHMGSLRKTFLDDNFSEIFLSKYLQSEML